MAVARVIQAGLALKTPDLAVAVVDARPMPDAWDERLAAQSLGLAGLFEAQGFHVLESDRPAALVASYVEAASRDGYDCVVLASDKRFAQLVAADVWWYDGYKRVRYTPEAVRKRFLVEPARVADWLALVGDETCLAGVKGVGAKGAAGLVEATTSLRDALLAPEELPGRAGKTLRDQLQLAAAQLQLAHLDREVPLPKPLDALAFGAPSVAERNHYYAEMGFYRLLVAEREAPRCQVLDDLPESFGLRAAAIAVVTEAPSPARGDWVGLGLATDDHALYFPRLRPRLRGWLEDPAAPKTGHHSKEAMVALAREGVTLRGVTGDSVVASHLRDPSGSAPHELEQLTRALLRRPIPEPEQLLGRGARTKQWSDLAPARAGAYACQRASAAQALWDRLSPEVPPDQVDEYLALSETLARMELAGVPCDADELAAAGRDFSAMAGALAAEIHALAGHPFNLRSTKQLGEVLYTELGLTVHSRTRTGWSTATHALERLAHDHPIVPLVIRYRRLERLRTSWVVALLAAIGPDGRVHTSFHPARSFSGRLVNSAPDLGRVPGATPEMLRIRAAFRARPGWALLSVDYDQLGLYVLAHLTGDPALVEPLLRGDDMHAATAAAVLDRPLGMIDTEARQVGKVVNFATFAGQGASALGMQLGVSVAEAREMIARFDRRYATTRAFQDEQLRLARERGWIETLAGRRWPIRDVHSNDPQMRAYGERLARRATHEASVADVTRRSLLRADQALRSAGSAAVPLLQIHDEVLFEVPEPALQETAHIAAAAFASAFELRVPLRVACKAGPSWASLERLRLS